MNVRGSYLVAVGWAASKDPRVHGAAVRVHLRSDVTVPGSDSKNAGVSHCVRCVQTRSLLAAGGSVCTCVRKHRKEKCIKKEKREREISIKRGRVYL